MSNSDCIVRNYSPSDFKRYARLHVQSGDFIPRKALEERLDQPNLIPEENVFVLETGGEIVGCLAITPEQQIGRIIVDCLIHPLHRRKGLASSLLPIIRRRAEELKIQIAHANIFKENSAATRLLLLSGFQPIRQYIELQLRLEHTAWPKATGEIKACRHLNPGEEGLLTTLQNLTFANSWGFNPNTTEEITYRINQSNCCHSDVIILYEEQEPIGYCWTAIEHSRRKGQNSGTGRIHMIGVHPKHRARGLGRVVLTSGLLHLKEKGFKSVVLTVDDENTAALSLYRSVGFEPWATSIWYEKHLLSND